MTDKIVKAEFSNVSGKMDAIKGKLCEHVYNNPDAEELKSILRECLKLLNQIEDALEKITTKGE